MKVIIEDGLESYDADFNLPNIIKDLKKRKLDNVQEIVDKGLKEKMALAMTGL